MHCHACARPPNVSQQRRSPCDAEQHGVNRLWSYLPVGIMAHQDGTQTENTPSITFDTTEHYCTRDYKQTARPPCDWRGLTFFPEWTEIMRRKRLNNESSPYKCVNKCTELPLSALVRFYNDSIVHLVTKAHRSHVGHLVFQTSSKNQAPNNV